MDKILNYSLPCSYRQDYYSSVYRHFSISAPLSTATTASVDSN